MVGLLGGLMPGEDPMQPAALVPRGLLEMLGPSVMSRMQAREKQQEARMAAGDRSPTPLDEEGMMLADDLAGGLLGTISRVDDLPEMIARLLREGRAAEVTDDLLGRLTPNQNARLVELYEAGATGMPMPMDEASRMARAEGMGVNVNDWRYHGTRNDVPAFDPSKAVDNSVHLGSTPEQAGMRTYGEGANIIPAYIKEGRMRRSRDSDGYWKDRVKSAKKAGTDTVQYLNRYEGIPRERIEALNESGMLPKLDNLTDAQFRRAVPEAADSYLVMNPANIRSRFARFDPRLRNNANLLAGIGGLGLLGVQLDQQPEGNW